MLGKWKNSFHIEQCPTVFVLAQWGGQLQVMASKWQRKHNRLKPIRKKKRENAAAQNMIYIMYGWWMEINLDCLIFIPILVFTSFWSTGRFGHNDLKEKKNVNEKDWLKKADLDTYRRGGGIKDNGLWSTTDHQHFSKNILKFAYMNIDNLLVFISILSIR